MAATAYVLTVRDSSSDPPGAPVTGLASTLSWTHLKAIHTPYADVPQPTFTELGHGQYVFSYDPEANGEAAGVVDCGSARATQYDRYHDMVLDRDSSRIQGALSAAGLVQHDFAQAVPTSNTAQTVGDALNAARCSGFGKWVLAGTSLRLYAADGTTVVRTFTLDSALAPSQRV